MKLLVWTTPKYIFSPFSSILGDFLCKCHVISVFLWGCLSEFLNFLWRCRTFIFNSFFSLQGFVLQQLLLNFREVSMMTGSSNRDANKIGRSSSVQALSYGIYCRSDWRSRDLCLLSRLLSQPSGAAVSSESEAPVQVNADPWRANLRLLLTW